MLIRNVLDAISSSISHHTPQFLKNTPTRTVLAVAFSSILGIIASRTRAGSTFKTLAARAILVTNPIFMVGSAIALCLTVASYWKYSLKKNPPNLPNLGCDKVSQSGSDVPISSNEKPAESTPTATGNSAPQLSRDNWNGIETVSPSLSHPPLNLPNLESEFENQAFCDVDVTKNCDFRDYLVPNELNPYDVLPHLKTMSQGLIVSTGTERSFFDLILADPEKCTGLVIRDINSRVKAYVDFNILLLKISTTREEYLQLSNCTHNDKKLLNTRIKLISEKVKESGFSKKTESYYLKHLEAFGEIYLTYATWKESHGVCFQNCRYDQDDRLFLILQKFAKSGNIISTIGDINELKFLRDKKIAAVDTSNIHYYSVIHLQGEGDFRPLLIWADGQGLDTTYYSIPHSEMCTEQEKQEFDKLVEILLQSQTLTKGKDFSMGLHNLLGTIAYSKKNLLRLQEYINEVVIQDANLGPIDIWGSFNKKFKNLTTDQIQILTQNPKTKLVLSFIFNQWVTLTSHQFLAFCQIEGWQNDFESLFKHPRTLLGFLKKLDQAQLLDQFVQMFGAERLEKFEKSLSTTS